MLAVQHHQLAEHYRRRWLEAATDAISAPFDLPRRIARDYSVQINAMWHKFRAHARAANPLDTYPDDENAMTAVLHCESLVARAEAIEIASDYVFLRAPGGDTLLWFSRKHSPHQAGVVAASIARGEFIPVGEREFMSETIKQYERPKTGQAGNTIHKSDLASCSS